MKFNVQIIVVVILAILVLDVLLRSTSEGYRNYVNLGSLTQEFNATHPQRRVSGPFMHKAPGE